MTVKMLRYILAAILPAVVLGSCIRDEALNAECDITAASLPGDVLNGKTEITNDKVLMVVKKDVELTALAPEFTLTPGATIDPASGTARDFTEPQAYTVTSQDRKWKKTYTVTIQRNYTIPLAYDFENVDIISTFKGGYDEFYQTGTPDVNPLTWASANSAFNATGEGTTPQTFPTYQGDNGVEGKCAVLVTKSTGFLGTAVGKPIAAGNLFMGVFIGDNAMMDPLGATHFGVPFSEIPTSFSGYYKYTPGEQFCELHDKKFEPVPGKTDLFNLYTVFYEVSEQYPYLDGNNVLSADNIICTAEIPDRHASDEWVYFNIPFAYRDGKTIDTQKLRDGRYRIAVIASSSQDGDRFAGAIGSKLQIDELRLTVQPHENTDEQ